jgi:uncharacterized membrane protein
MKLKIRPLLIRLFSTYWFLPSTMAVAAVGLSVLTVRADQVFEDRISPLFWLYAGGPEGARILLSSVAGSMITVAGVTFSITIVALSFASTQLGPRLLDNFLRDRGNQIVLGTFISTFLYCLLVLRIHYRAGDFVPPEKDIVTFWPPKRLDEKVDQQINGASVIGVYPSWNQDVIYAVNQLVAVALRALSPSINDPFLAMSCIDRLGAALIRLAQKSLPPSYRYDENGRLRLITHSFSFNGVLDRSFDQIRRAAVAEVAVTVRLLETLAIIAGVVERTEQKEASVENPGSPSALDAGDAESLQTEPLDKTLEVGLSFFDPLEIDAQQALAAKDHLDVYGELFIVEAQDCVLDHHVGLKLRRNVGNFRADRRTDLGYVHQLEGVDRTRPRNGNRERSLEHRSRVVSREDPHPIGLNFPVNDVVDPFQVELREKGLDDDTGDPQ